MTREEVIKELSLEYLGDSEKIREAKKMAIQALEQTELKPSYNSIKTELDLISRQAVLEKSYKIAGYDRNSYVVDVADIETMPSVSCTENPNRSEIKQKCDRINSLASVLPYAPHREIQELLCEIMDMCNGESEE